MEKIVYAKPVGYEFKEFLGEGLNSCVYRAIKQNQEHGVKLEVALKILKSETLVSVWRNEFDRLASIQSKNCVRLLGWEMFNNKPTLVLEYVDGVNLEDYSTYAQLNQSQLFEIYSQCFQGICDLFAAKLYHGDLNLNNIMVDSHGCVKLVDFGVRGTHGEIFATPQYSAPSVLMGDEPDFTSDKLSLELIFKELAERCGLSLQGCENYVTSEAVRSELALKVQLIQRFKKNRRGLTKNIKALDRPIIKLQSLKVKLALLIFLIWPLVSMGDQSLLQLKPKYVKILIRTTKWVKVRINSGPEQYSPAEAYINLDARNVIHWESALDQGSRYLTAYDVKHTVILGDSFFIR